MLETAAVRISFDQVINSWKDAGFFSIILPFLLVFALVFGILTRVKIFKENKAINAIIAAVVALMALQVPMVPEFFSQLFPRMGIALGIILVLMIIAGFFADPNSPVVNYVLLGIGVIIVIVVLIQTAGGLGLQSGEWWGVNWPVVAGALFILILVVVIVAGTSSPDKGKNTPEFKGYWARHEGAHP
jgi:peptidoglycan/LPS O-acetylase OafA/YrhL